MSSSVFASKPSSDGTKFVELMNKQKNGIKLSGVIHKSIERAVRLVASMTQ